MTDADMMWVHPAFKKKLKIEAVKNGKSVLQYTKELATKDELVNKPIPKSLKKSKQGGFQFGF